MNQSIAIATGNTDHWSVQFFIFMQLIVSVFIAEDGQECLSDKRDGLQDCFSKSMKDIIPNDFSLENLPLLVMGEGECNKFTTLQHCFVKELETCKDKAPANVMEALFKFVHKTLPCSTERQARAAGDGGSLKFGNNSSPLVSAVQHTSNYVVQEGENILHKIINETEEAIYLLTFELKKKCLRNSDFPLAFPNVNASLGKFLHWIRTVQGFPELCEVYVPSSKRSFEKFTVDLKLCLTDKEDFLPQFLMDAVNSTFNYLCEDEYGRLKYFSDTGLQGSTKMSKDPLRHCFNSIVGDQTGDEEIIFKESTVCKSLQNADKCVTSHCPKGARLTDLAHGVFQRLQAPCSGSSIFLRNTVLLSALILFYFRKLWY